MSRKDCERHRSVTSRGLSESRVGVNGCVNVFHKDCEWHRLVTSRGLRESRESVNGDLRCSMLKQKMAACHKY